MKFTKIKSYAKVNLSLNIVGKLKSKKHKIESLVTFANLYDLIYLRPINSYRHKIYFSGRFGKRISNKNTVSKLLQKPAKKKLLNNQNFEIKIKKKYSSKIRNGWRIYECCFFN